MPTQRKIEQVAELERLIDGATITIGGDYRGLRVNEMAALRRRMREAGAEVRVVKNTLLRRAAEATGRPQVVEIATGPTAIIVSRGDGVAVAKALTEFIRTSRSTFALHGALAEGQVMSAAEVQDYATLPGREALLSQLMGALQSPIANLVGLLSATIREFAGLVEARAAQLESAG